MTINPRNRIRIVRAEQADDGEWEIEIGMEPLQAYAHNEEFLDRLSGILEGGLEAGLEPDQLEEMLNTNWEERVPWRLVFDIYDQEIVRMRQDLIRSVR